MVVLETARLVLRELTLEDAEFVLRLLNEPSFLRHIGDKKVRTLEDARGYLTSGPLAMYARHGFGLWLTALRDGTSIGICGLVRRETLDDVDVGFAFLPEHWSRGYASESAAAVLAHGHDVLRIDRIIGLANPDNAASIRVLTKLGLSYEGTVTLVADGPEVEIYG